MYVETDKKSVIRDTRSKGLVMTDNQAYEKFKRRQSFEKRVMTLENKMDRILEILEKGIKNDE